MKNNFTHTILNILKERHNILKANEVKSLDDFVEKLKQNVEKQKLLDEISYRSGDKSKTTNASVVVEFWLKQFGLQIKKFGIDIYEKHKLQQTQNSEKTEEVEDSNSKKISSELKRSFEKFSKFSKNKNVYNKYLNPSFNFIK